MDLRHEWEGHEFTRTTELPNQPSEYAFWRHG